MRQQIRDYFDNLSHQAQKKRGRIEYAAYKVFRRYLNTTTNDEADLCKCVRTDLMRAMDGLIRRVFQEPMTISIGFGIHATVTDGVGGVQIDRFEITSLYVNDVNLMEPYI